MSKGVVITTATSKARSVAKHFRGTLAGGCSARRPRSPVARTGLRYVWTAVIKSSTYTNTKSAAGYSRAEGPRSQGGPAIVRDSVQLTHLSE